MQTRSLIIDLGNTRIKWAILTSPRDEPLRHGAIEAQRGSAGARSWVDLVLHTLMDEPDPDWLIYGASGGLNPDAINEFIDRLGRPVAVHVTPKTHGYVSSSYTTPQTLGTDRWAAVHAAYDQDPTAHWLIINVGTATTVDFLSNDATYRGGVILPSLEMQAEALHEKTAKLPEVSISHPLPLLGLSTEQAIAAGLWNVYSLGILGIRDQLNAQYGPHKLIVTGGGWTEAMTAFFTPDVHDPWLVMRGLMALGQSK